MESDEKSCLTRLGNINEFDESIRKLTLEDVMTFKEKSYILSCALMFLEEFKKDNRLKTFLEFGYSIILKYSIQYKDYQPLYDFSINFGFYPISKFIKQHRLIDDYNIMNEINDINIQKKYLHNNYIETFEQNRTQKNILNSDSSEISFIAPTSSGKSALIIEHIKRNFESGIKIGIIVPTKSLLMQTYKIIKESKINCKIIIHDEMYNDELEFIGVLTQERALRLIERYNIYFDTLYIDEAHNLFNYDSRNILLARLLRKNKNKNSNQKVMYLSPLIFDSNNLKFDNSEIIDEQRIDFNIKEPEYYEYKMNKEIYKFNRFIGKFYKYGKSNDIYGYINNNSQKKNFIYLYSPRKIEMFSKKLYNNLNIIENNIQINEMINMLNKYVHKDFYINTLLSKGIVYLHGKLPDYIKEYLEYKFKNILELKYLVANSVILEGMNLPIDNLFILNTYNLNEKELTNLIGRVNRLNIVFSGDETSLSKLQPTIHFVNSEQWNKKNSSMESKIKSLRTSRFKDIIENPTLINFSFEKLHINEKAKERKLNEFKNIKKYENYVLSQPKNEFNKAKIKFIEYGLEKIYKNFTDDLVQEIYNRILNYKLKQKFMELHVIDKIYYIFIRKIEDIKDFQISRLYAEEARNFYKIFTKKVKLNSLNEVINWQFLYFKQCIRENKNMFYMGLAYGEVSKKTTYYKNPIYNVYVDLSTKGDAELINLAIVKIKMEEDFISFELNKLINLMLDFEVITKDEYNVSVYGTNDTKILELLKMGLPLNIISKLKEDKQINNIYLDNFNNIICNSNFVKYKATVDDFYKFQYEKFI